jgi:N-acetylated-alpha-linked acidic dipeptidase
MKNLLVILQFTFCVYLLQSQNKINDFYTTFQSYQPTTSFESHLKEISKNPHITASKANEEVRDYLVKSMKNAGFEVEVVPYDVYLPEMPGINEVEIVGPVAQKLTTTEKVVEGDVFSAHPNNTNGFNAFSGSGDVTGNVVYVNYGTKTDFEYLKEKGISLKGKIALARYGGNFRGFKAKFAQENGCVGLIIYTDPLDSGYSKGFVYPEGIYYDETAIQRGSLLTKDWSGDPLTPFEPALPLDGKVKIKRLNENEINLPKIPVIPIGYGAAAEIFKLMKGKDATPRNWQGGLPYTYRIESGEALKVRINVVQKKKIQRVYNVIGTLKGATLPNEWIILGCHYDAWTFGAIDPNSGTSMLLSIADTFGAMAKQAKKLDRTIKICHWDAEEVGLMGSTEWVEQHKTELQQKTVAYLNADACISGPNFSASASPTLKQLILDVTQKINHPDAKESVYNVWKKDKDTPEIGSLGGGSDHLAFIAYAGIPSINMGMGGSYLYHTNYDNFAFYQKFADPKFNYAKTTKDIFGLSMITLSNTNTIALKLENYGKDCSTNFENLDKKLKKENVTSFNFDNLIAKSKELMQKGKEIDSKLTTNTKNISKINEVILKLDQNWIHPDGMPYGKWYQSLYVSSDPYSGYASWILPGFMYSMENKKYDELKQWETKYLESIQKISNDYDLINKYLE